MILWAARRPAVVWAVCAALLLAGGVAVTRLPIATRPTVELPRLSVSMQWPGASAELVETWLGAPMEAAVQAVRGVKRLDSESNEGWVELDVALQPGADVQLARLAILERLDLLRRDFPPGATGLSVSNYVPAGLEDEPLLSYTVYGPYTAGALQELVDRQVRPRIAAVAGVAGAAVQGGALVGIAVTYDAGRLRQLGILPAALDAALAEARVVEALGREQAGATERRVVLRDVPAALAALGRLPVRGPGDRVYRLDALASLRRDEDTQDQFFRINGEPAVLLRVARLPAADAIATARAVRAALAELGPRLPPGLRFQVLDDESRRLGAQLDDLARRGAIAAALVVAVLLLTLRAPRAVALVLGGAAVALAGTALGLYLLGIPANLLTLAGLGMGIGILVQNGVVVVDRLRGVADTVEARARAGRQITPAVLGATLTTAVVLLPFLYLQGDARAAFTPFATAFALALGCSIPAAVVVIPALARGHALHEVRWPRLARAYRAALTPLLRWRRATIALTAVALAALGWVFVVKVPRTSFSGWWAQRTVLAANLSFPSGSDPASLDRSLAELERVVVGRPGVELVQAAGDRDGGRVAVVFDERAARGVLPYALQDELTRRAALIGGAAVSVSGRGPGFASGGSVGSPQSFRIKILGYSFAGVERLALDLKARLERIPRVRDVNVDAGGFWIGAERARDVTLVPDRAALASHGLTAAEFAAAVRREAGGTAGRRRIELGDETLWLSLKAEGARARAVEELRTAEVAAGQGGPVRLGDVAALGERVALSRISREAQQYVRVLSYEFRGPQKLADRTHEAFMRSIGVPAGYSVSDAGFGWQDDKSQQGLWLVFGVGVALVLLTVAMVFNSVWGAVMVLLSLPMALAGVVVAFWLPGAAFTREAAVGVILVVGLAVNQAILLVDGVLAIGRGPGSPKACLGATQIQQAAEDRAGMIMLVTLTTLASLLPLAWGTSATDLFGAIALATAGGTVAGTLAALFLLPPLLLRGPSVGPL